KKSPFLIAHIIEFKPLSLLIFTVTFAAVGAGIVLYTQAAQNNKRVASSANAVSGVKLLLVPSSQKVSASGIFTVGVWTDTVDQPVNAVQANLTYSPDKFDFVSIDPAGSAFEIEAQSTGAS